VPPDAAMVVFGKKREIGFQIIKGGGKFILPI